MAGIVLAFAFRELWLLRRYRRKDREMDRDGRREDADGAP